MDSRTLSRILSEIRGYRAAPNDSLIKVVNFQTRQIWVWIPKNAGGSICRQLLTDYPDDTVAAAVPLETLRTINPELKKFEVVAFKRNPYTRAVSCWLNKIAALKTERSRILERFTELQGMTFCDFATWLNTTAGSDELSDPHWLSQHKLLAGVDRVIAFESLPDAVVEIGIEPARLLHKNAHERMVRKAGFDPRPLLEWYDWPSFEAITRRYESDLHQLSYSYSGDMAVLKIP